jgi:hypothetical protein
MTKARLLQRFEWHLSWFSGAFIIKRKKAIPHLKGTAVFAGESKDFIFAQRNILNCSSVRAKNSQRHFLSGGCFF